MQKTDLEKQKADSNFVYCYNCFKTICVECQKIYMLDSNHKCDEDEMRQEFMYDLQAVSI